MLLVYGRVDLKLYSGFMAEWTSNCAMSSWQSGPQIVLWVFGRGDFSSNRGQHRWPHTQAIAWPWDRWDADKRNEFRPLNAFNDSGPQIVLLVHGRVDLKLFSGFKAEWTSNCVLGPWQSGPQIVLWVFDRVDLKLCY